MTVSATTSTMSTMKRAVRTAAIAAAAVIAVAACSNSQTSAATSSTTSSLASAAPGSGGAAGTATYRLHMDFFSHESKLSTVLDPQVFRASAGAAAGPGPQGILYAAGIAPTPKDAPAATTLLGADGTALNVSLGQWEKARHGGVLLRCRQRTGDQPTERTHPGGSLQHVCGPSGCSGYGTVHPVGRRIRQHQQLHRQRQRHGVGEQQRLRMFDEQGSSGDLAQRRASPWRRPKGCCGSPGTTASSRRFPD